MVINDGNLANMQNDDAWATYSQVNEWIRFADVKATALLAVSGVLGGLLISSAPAGTCTGCQTQRILYAIATGAVVLSTVMSLVALVPRLGRRDRAASLLYFDHIARRNPHDRKEFILAFLAMVDDPAALRHEIAAQVWSNSQVARRKFRSVTFATWLVAAAMLLSGLAAIVRWT